MSTDFQYSTDFYGMNANELSHTCMHLLCLAGEASFVFNEHCYHIIKNDLDSQMNKHNICWMTSIVFVTARTTAMYSSIAN